MTKNNNYMSQNIEDLILELKTINPDKPDLQWQASIQLGKKEGAKNNQKIIEALLGALELNNFALTRAHAAEALGNFGNLDNPQILQKLMVSLKDPYQLVRSYSARALGKLKDERAIPALKECLELDQFYGTRAEAAEALGVICEKSKSKDCRDARKALEKAKKDEEKRKKEEPRSERPRREAETAFKKIKMTMNSLKQDLNGFKKDMKKMGDTAEKISKRSDKSNDKELKAAIKKFNEYKRENDKRTVAIATKIERVQDEIEEVAVPLFVHVSSRRSK